MSNLDKYKTIYVFAHWEELEKPVVMGLLKTAQTRGKEIFSFEYDDNWLKSGNVQFLDPDLQFYKGTQYTRNDKTNFGLFLDSSPDRWGKMLMRRREMLHAKSEKRTARNLTESDYLLGLFDGNRMGALRFKEKVDGPFLNDNKSMATPPWTTLKELEYASLQIEKDNIVKNSKYEKWLNMLIDPGSSLGGARPKASVVDSDNHLWIAKFPSRNDEVNKGAWEIIMNEMCKKCNIDVPESAVMKLTSRHHTFLTKRFDRTNKGKRRHFASAMTMLGYTDHQDGAGYFELAEFLIRNGSNTDKDLEEIWRRIVFNICVKNTDDHLRNHGFILSKSGWILSPAYDINPESQGKGLCLNISENDNSLDLQLALEVAENYRVNKKKANEIINTIKKVVSSWRVYANKYGIPKGEQELMSNAFWKD